MRMSALAHVRAGLRLAGACLPILVLLPIALGLRAVSLVGGERLRARCLKGGVACQTLWARCVLFATGVELCVEGPPPRMRCVVAANHLSYMDIAVLAHLFPGRFVAKQEIAGWPVFGLLSRSVATLFIERGRRRDVVRVGREMRATLEAGLSVLLFPEGGTSRGESVQRFHSALFESASAEGLPCLPVAVSYSTAQADPPAGAVVCWWGGAPLPGHLWRCLGLERIRARVRWPAEPVRSLDRKELASRAQEAVSGLFEPVEQAPEPEGGNRAPGAYA